MSYCNKAKSNQDTTHTRAHTHTHTHTHTYTHTHTHKCTHAHTQSHTKLIPTYLPKLSQHLLMLWVIASFTDNVWNLMQITEVTQLIHTCKQKPQ